MRLVPFFWRRTLKHDEPHPKSSTPGIRTEVHGDKALLTVDLDVIGREAAPQVEQEVVKICGLPLFEGTIEHGYARRSVESTDRCPRCGAATRHCTARFIYATSVAPRAMLAPAGYFCTGCATVIVDEQIISVGAKKGHRYRCVVGIDHGGNRTPDYFRTWNGQKPIYVLDEDEQIMDLLTDAQVRPLNREMHTRHNGRQQRRKKMARQARRRNRRR